jgi:iron-sulfur cluster repair protein YtfE (RIC family)
MNQARRDDFFTLIHKGLRRELFAVTTLAGTIDWTDVDDVQGFDSRWRDLHHLLEIHAAHEDEHFLPLLDRVAQDVRDRMTTDHQEQDAALGKLNRLIDATVAAPTEADGLIVHRELSSFVAGYLQHLLDEETVVMPAIWQHRTDDELARTRAAFLARMPPADGALSRRVMLPAMSPVERAGLLATVQASAPAPVFAAVLDEAREHLDEASWNRLATDLDLDLGS